jgi:hypothetical protein
MKKYIKIGLLLLAFACQSSDSERFEYTYNNAIVADFLSAEATFSDFFRLTMKATTNPDFLTGTMSTIDSALVSKQGNQYIFSYDTNQHCPDGSIRFGTFSIETDALMTDSASTATINLNNLIINNKTINGIVIIKNKTGGLKPVFSMNISDGMIQLNDAYNSVIKYSLNFSLRWKKGLDTPTFHSDDIFYLTGTSEGKAHQFDRFTSTVTDTIAFSHSCRYFRGGLTLVKMPDFEVNEAKIQYNEIAGCSSTVEVTYKGTTPSGDKVTSQPFNFNIGL